MTTRGLLDKELDRLREFLVKMEDMVSTAIMGSVQALKERDVAAAEKIIENDEKINKLRYRVERLGVVAIATQQPMASDLRTIIAAMHIAIEMERMGDHAAGIANLVKEVAKEPLLKPLIDVPRMAVISCEMLHSAIQAFLSGDVAAAKETAKRDSEVDQLYDQVLRELLTYMIQDPKNIQRATILLWSAHGLERTADRVTNVCERVLFMETGKFKELR
ncbi:MAG: phosphate signaling complex protein PhoU [Anaerolineales bacterium]|nr:MAG: phosphate signaling complex protein PhoU [Anaerolineales bacterium]